MNPSSSENSKPRTNVASLACPEARDLDEALSRLRALLLSCQEITVAVSGGVDSLTLAAFAHEVLGDKAVMVHALSPAVPAEATRRVRAFARSRRAPLRELDAGEFSDEAYRVNPANRCYFCKSHLYDAIRSRFHTVVVSGANLDDLEDFRPGLIAAREKGVRHLLIEAGLSKARVREVARHLGLGALAELPPSPCLSSRVETGIRIEANALAFIDSVETELRRAASPGTVRCRVRRSGIVVEMDESSLLSMSIPDRAVWTERIRLLARASGLEGDVAFEIYRQGSAFLRPSA